MSTLSIKLREILVHISGYYLIPMLIIGIISNIINIIIFRKSTLKNNGCSLYFICISITHLFVLIFGCLFRIISHLSGFDLSHSSLFFCKFRIYFFISGIVLSRYYLCLISIDRWMITSINARIRRQSNIHSIRRLIIISTIFWLLFNLHSPIGFRQQINGCVPSSENIYSTFYLITNILFSIIPFIILILFTTITLRHLIKKKLIRKRVQSVHPTEFIQRNLSLVIQHEQISNKNIQLIRINLIQVIFFILLNLPNTIYTMYSFITQTFNKTNEQIIIDNFFNLMSSNLLYTHCAITFFLYTLASATFRKECWTTYHYIQRHIAAFLHLR